MLLMVGNAARRPNQPPGSGPALGSMWIGMLGPMPMDDHWDDGPKYRDTQTPTSSRCTCFDPPEDDTGEPYAAPMIPSPLGRGLPSRFGFGKSF
jgi:hypothetical protein